MSDRWGKARRLGSLLVLVVALAAPTQAVAGADVPFKGSDVGEFAAAILAASAPADASQNPSGYTASSYLEPVTLSPECTSDQRRRSACRLIRSFFRAVNSRDFEKACALLGKRMRSDWHGVTCPASLDGMVLEPVPWGILGAQIARRGVSVLLVVGQNELERFWMRRHRAYVAHEDGRLRILETKLVS